jgi:excisionase family DNA binding protein
VRVPACAATVGPKEEVGNKGGPLSNRLRAVLYAYAPHQARSNADRAFLRQDPRPPERFFGKGGVIFVYSRKISWTRTDAHRLDEVTARMAPEEGWVGVEDVAAHLRVARESIYRWIDSKGFPAHRVARLLRFKLSEVDEWVQARGGVDSGSPAPIEETGPKPSRRESPMKKRKR